MVISIEDPSCTAVVAMGDVSCDTTGAYHTNDEVNDFDISSFGRGLRRPEDGYNVGAYRRHNSEIKGVYEFRTTRD
jgi:hypothetical protein